MILIAVTIILIFIIIFIFSSPKLSPIPYYPSNKKDLPLIIKALNLKNNQLVFDLGAGDGIIIFEAAKIAYGKKINAVFVAVEINPILVLILHLKRFFHQNKKNIKIVWGDMFKINIKNQISKIKPDDNPKIDNKKNLRRQSKKLAIKKYSNITIYLYISPWLIEKILAVLKKQLPRFSLISYYYPVKTLKEKEKITSGIHQIHTYEVCNEVCK
ncbi:MAG: rRNA adenine N-6-methyltransferase family protein [Microgenomates group bacterium]|nr:rRNA adenine N-6-methyltransferase family protein [Microgenomates group bacterium]